MEDPRDHEGERTPGNDPASAERFDQAYADLRALSIDPNSNVPPKVRRIVRCLGPVEIALLRMFYGEKVPILVNLFAIFFDEKRDKSFGRAWDEYALVARDIEASDTTSVRVGITALERLGLVERKEIGALKVSLPQGPDSPLASLLEDALLSDPRTRFLEWLALIPDVRRSFQARPCGDVDIKCRIGALTLTALGLELCTMSLGLGEPQSWAYG